MAMKTTAKVTTYLWTRTVLLLLLVMLQHDIAVRAHDSRRNRRNKQEDVTAAFFAQNQRKACRFYVWNVVSAGLHSVCEHLCKDCVYEGRGGRKFVLIPPGSLLQLLYPSRSQYSPDACVWCGGTQRDHVALQWSKTHLYSPFDLWLDRTQEQAKSVQVLPKVWKNVSPDQKTIYKFHQLYVADDEPSVVTKNDGARSYSNVYGVRYSTLPKEDGDKPAPQRSLGTHGIRKIVEHQLRKLIQIQEVDNEVMDLKEHGQYSRHSAARVEKMLQKRQFRQKLVSKATKKQESTKIK